MEGHHEEIKSFLQAPATTRGKIRGLVIRPPNALGARIRGTPKANATRRKMVFLRRSSRPTKVLQALLDQEGPQ